MIAGSRGHSPTKKSGSQSSLNQHQQQQQQLSPKQTLLSLFDNTSTNNMSTFRLLYNLEVLSGKLMPVTTDMTVLKGARTFCDEFLDAGGLQLVVNVLRPDAIAPDVDYETRQGCYSIALQLLRYVTEGDLSTILESNVITK